MDVLLSPQGCPWDREQTHESLKPYLIEEAYEALEAIDAGDDRELCKELGDVILQVVFHAALARQQGRFSIDDVCSAICDKLIFRHPHVFGNVAAGDSATVLRNWEAIKKEEKSQAQKRRVSILDGIPSGMPALARAHRLQERAAKVGFDWPRVQETIAKLEEEVEEFKKAVAANKPDAIEDEMGDLLFALVNVSRFVQVHPEEALRKTIRKFIRRFQHVEAEAERQGRRLEEMTLAEMDALWDDAKRLEREEPA
ncbi:MAG: hypothetical protein Kow0059_03970 [Candidatus Sumerlaeia bacterium]